jgi:hypothetical protein
MFPDLFSTLYTLINLFCSVCNTESASEKAIIRLVMKQITSSFPMRNKSCILLLSEYQKLAGTKVGL